MRNFRLLVVSAVTLALAVSFSFAGCSAQRQDDAAPAAADDAKTLVVGCDDYSPFTYIDEKGDMTGIDVDIITEACRRIGYQAKCELIDWESKNDLLESGQIDCIGSCFSMSGREGSYKWAGPYMRSRQVVAVAPSSDIVTLADLQDKVIAVRSTTKSESIILNDPDDALPEVKSVLSFADRAYLVPALLKGYVDAIASHETSIVQYEKDYGVDVRILDEPLLETGVGFAFSLDDDRGIDEQLAAALDEMRADGTMEQILSKYLDDPESFLDLNGIG